MKTTPHKHYCIPLQVISEGMGGGETATNFMNNDGFGDEDVNKRKEIKKKILFLLLLSPDPFQ